MSTKKPVLMTAQETAKLLRTTTNTLATWRCRKTGPPYCKVKSTILYDLEELNVWIRKHRN